MAAPHHPTDVTTGRRVPRPLWGAAARVALAAVTVGLAGRVVWRALIEWLDE